jgi:hypothetical protein
MTRVCPACGANLPGHAWCLPLGRALALIGGLALVAAYFMPWFGISSPQGSVVLTGEFLGRFLAGTNDLSRFLPGSSGDPSEARLLRALIYLFPTSGALAAVVALVAAFRPGLRSPVNLLLALLGAVPLLALIIGLSRLPPGASQEVGLRLIGAGAVAILLGAGLDAASGERRAAGMYR